MQFGYAFFPTWSWVIFVDFEKNVFRLPQKPAFGEGINSWECKVPPPKLPPQEIRPY